MRVYEYEIYMSLLIPIVLFILFLYLKKKKKPRKKRWIILLSTILFFLIGIIAVGRILDYFYDVTERKVIGVHQDDSKLSREEKEIEKAAKAYFKKRYGVDVALYAISRTPLGDEIRVYLADDPEFIFGADFGKEGDQVWFGFDNYLYLIIDRMVEKKRLPMIKEIYSDLLPANIVAEAFPGDTKEWDEFRANYRGEPLPDIDEFRMQFPKYREDIVIGVIKNLDHDREKEMKEAERLFQLVQYYRERKIGFSFRVQYFDEAIREKGETEAFLKEEELQSAGHPFYKYKRASFWLQYYPENPEDERTIKVEQLKSPQDLLDQYLGYMDPEYIKELEQESKQE